MKHILRFLGFHIHEWSRWECVIVDVTDDDTCEPYKVTNQKRECGTCGKIKVKGIF